MYVNTLGVALYRAGQWAEAIAALTESSEAQPNHAVYDWLDLAMAHWQRGEKDAALQWHAKAADGIKANPDLKQLEPTQVDELRRFFAEASELLGIKVELPSHGGEKP
jgi:tetratricopeptide (TPR) repeat protein